LFFFTCCSTYTIGKERIVKGIKSLCILVTDQTRELTLVSIKTAIARELGTKIYCDARKAMLLRCQEDPELLALLTDNPLEAGVHLVPLGMAATDRVKDYMAQWHVPIEDELKSVENTRGNSGIIGISTRPRWTRVLAFRPTGWTYTPPVGTDMSPSIPSIIARDHSRQFTYAHLRPSRNSTSSSNPSSGSRGSTGTTPFSCIQYGVPYSEHSSFSELTCFALSFDWYA